MKPGSPFLLIFLLFIGHANAQDLKTVAVPSVAKPALQKKYPEAKAAQWGIEKENYEANWGGKSAEDNSVQFTSCNVLLF